MAVEWEFVDAWICGTHELPPEAGSYDSTQVGSVIVRRVIVGVVVEWSSFVSEDEFLAAGYEWI